MSGLEIALTKRYIRSEESLGAKLSQLNVGALHDFVRTYEGAPSKAAFRYDRVGPARLDGQILEIDISGKDRLIAHWAPTRLTLLEVGDHEIVGRFKRGRASLASLLAGAVPASAGHYRPLAKSGKFFASARSTHWESFPGEDSTDWLYTLSTAQQGVAGNVRKLLTRASLLDQRRALSVGGPGTGKTSVVLRLLGDAAKDGLKVALSISDELAEFLKASGTDVSQFRMKRTLRASASQSRTYDLILADDPASAWEIEASLDDSYGRSRAVVIAFDPCQLSEDFRDVELIRLQESFGASLYKLRDCYRQRKPLAARLSE